MSTTKTVLIILLLEITIGAFLWQMRGLPQAFKTACNIYCGIPPK